MKRIGILLFALFVVGTLSAQGRKVTREVNGDYIKITKIIPAWENKHDIRVGVGTGSFVTGLFLDSYLIYGQEVYYNIAPITDFNQKVQLADTYLTNGYFTGTYSLSYTYQPRRWFQFGATTTFAAISKSRRNSITHKKVDNLNEYAISVLPTVRFIYFNRELVRLYSSLSLGAVFCCEFRKTYNYLEVIPWADVTLIGCTVGKKVFGFAELGCGVGGFGRIGIGYRFDSKKK